MWSVVMMIMTCSGVDANRTAWPPDADRGDRG